MSGFTIRRRIQLGFTEEASEREDPFAEIMYTRAVAV